jgi:hypothetical protein
VEFEDNPGAAEVEVALNGPHLDLRGSDLEPPTNVGVTGQDEVAAGEKLFGIPRTEVRNNSFHLNAGIDRAQFLFRGNRLRQGVPGVRFVKQGLPLKIGGLDKVPVNDFDRTDSRADKQVRSGGPNRPAANNGRPGREQAALPFGANPRKENLA